MGEREMKPILFSTEMVRAILEGRKTVTRRVVKPQPPENNPHNVNFNDIENGVAVFGLRNRPPYCIRIPYRVGDILYVRETWRVQSAHRFEADVRIEYAAGGPMTTIQFPGRKSQSHSRDKYDEFIGKWADDKFHPSIHMPKEAARVFLRVKNVRVERLQDITDAGAMDEGAEGVACDDHEERFFCPICCNTGWFLSPRSEFMNIWNSTIKKADLPRYGWAANPWVWAIGFERISKEESST